MGKAITSLIEFARLNGGVFTRSEALALGMTPTTLQRRIAEGVFIHHGPGVLALPGASDPHVLDLHVACRKLGAVVSHQSAAYLHELDRPRDLQATVSVQRNRTKDLAGVIVHQLGDLQESQITTMRGSR